MRPDQYDEGEKAPMDMPIEWVDAIRAWAAGNKNVAEVWLFGSRAKGTVPESDVDLGLGADAGNPTAIRGPTCRRATIRRSATGGEPI
ncbi:nucleotidyltransferase domain-containing protein [Methylobacterium sp. J-070]|uniref:nucleotidyltransferase domain-containing protein n=1 Tax=Methylobacterium sp. J-070 TaxID=2836650 RepID=UPI003918EB91